MTSRNLFQRLGRDRQGSTAVEFALLGSFMIALILGVLQIGIAMQNYNALRSIAGDVARYAMVEYQTGNEPDADLIQLQARGIARSSPYNIPVDGMTVNVDVAGTQRVPGAIEFTFTIRSRVTSILDQLGFDNLFITYSRPIFVVDEA